MSVHHRFKFIGACLALAFSLQTAAIAAPSAAQKQTSSKLSVNSQKPSTAQKSKKKAAPRKIARGFVPPPPAYMPSILPELYYKHDADEAEIDEAEEKPVKKVNPYAKYFYSSSNEVPKAVQARSGVSTWSYSNPN